MSSRGKWPTLLVLVASRAPSRSRRFVYTNGLAIAVVSSISSPRAQNIVFGSTSTLPASGASSLNVSFQR
jgi:hypothetical protein